MTVAELLEGSGVVPEDVVGSEVISAFVADSRQAVPGALFACMPSSSTDAHTFITSAVSKGAVAALVHSRAGHEIAKKAGICSVFIPDESDRFREALWRLAKTFFGNPTASMQVVGVTGTNGKTTTAWMLRDMCGSLGVRTAYLGTLGFHLRGEARNLENTTPFAIDLNRMLAEARDSGVSALAMEVSSHALKERRSDGVEFDAAIFTNLTQEHLDYHGTMADYEASKRRLFEELPKQSKKAFVGALNTDDPVGALWAETLDCKMVTYGLESGELRGEALEVLIDRISLRLNFRGKSVDVDVPVGGLFNVQNCMSAAAGFIALGHDLEQAAGALSAVRAVPGRFEAVPNQHGIGVIVDYAHTPDALVKLLESARMLKHRRIITVFGCGGDRAAGKRPKMAKAVSEYSDLTVVTSDNPRTEDPATIIGQVASGLRPGAESVQIIDRKEAIAHAVHEAEPGDVVVIAGKGHENYQIIGRTKYPMDDRDLARSALEGRS